MYSQNDEEKYILEYFKDKSEGRLLDIGAYDGKTFSNTLALLEKGWSGVLIEPSPSVFLKMVENTKHVKAQYVNCAIATESKLLEFFDSNGDAISSFVPSHVEKWKAGYNCNFTPYFIKTITPWELQTQFETVIDFINLDVEGLNLELFHELSKTKFVEHLKMICVEHDGHYEKMEQHPVFKNKGFKRIALNGENIILGR